MEKKSFKYFVGYKSGIGVVPLCIKLLQMSKKFEKFR